MAENTKKNSNLKKAKRFDIPMQAVVDNIVFTKTDAVAFYQLTNQVYDFLSMDQKRQLILRLTNAYNNLMQDRQEQLEGSLIETPVPVDVDAWAGQVREMANEWKPGIGFERYVTQQMMYLKESSYLKNVTLLSVNLGKRGALDMSNLNFFEMGLKGAVDYGKTWLQKSLQAPSLEISASEEKEFRRKEREIYSTLSVGHLRARRCTAEELLLFTKRQFYPAMPVPYLDVDHGNRLGPGDLDLELGSVIENKYRYLKISQMIDDQEFIGYRATLSIAKMQRITDFPSSVPFLSVPANLAAPFTCYSKFTLHPSSKMKKELEKKKKEQKDELENISSAQNSYDSAVDSLPADVYNSLSDIRQIESILAEDKAPWVEGSYRIVVEATSPDQLLEFCAKLKQEYDDLGILLFWHSGDQAEMLREILPGSPLKSTSFNQVTNLSMLPATGVNFATEVGDPIFGTD